MQENTLFMVKQHLKKTFLNIPMSAYKIEILLES